MKPIEKFAEYNKDNILGSFLQAETHLKNLRENADPEWGACIHKHLLEAQAELSELMSHEPKRQKEYHKLMVKTRKLRKDSIKGLSTKEAISRLRDIRGDFEKYVKGHDTEKCESCEPLENLLKKIMGKTKHLNSSGSQELNIKKHGGKMSREAVINGLVGNVVGKGVSVATPMVITGATAGIANKTIANVVIGAALAGASLYGKLPAKMDMIGAVAGTNLIASELIDLVMGYIPAPAAVAVAAPAMAVAPAVGGAYPYAPAFGAPGPSAQFANGSLIFVD